MAGVAGAHQRIAAAVTAWEGVTAAPHRFGGTEWRLGKREIGHIHGDWLVDIPFPIAVRNQVVAAGRAQPHHLLADSGWVSLYLHTPDDVETALSLLAESLAIARAQVARRLAHPPRAEPTQATDKDGPSA